MWRNFLIITVLMIGGGITTWLITNWSGVLTQNKMLSSKHYQSEGSVVPNFAFETISGDRYRSFDFKGKITIVHFWASWCPPCVVEFPDLVSLAKNNDKKITIIAVSTDRNVKAIKRFLDKNAPDIPDNFHVVFDDNKRITENLFGTFKLPETYIYNEDLIFQEKITGAYADWKNYVQ